MTYLIFFVALLLMGLMIRHDAIMGCLVLLMMWVNNAMLIKIIKSKMGDK